jgi:hypothetical protein
MSQAPLNDGVNKVSTNAKPVKLAPEPTFWKRYSPHHEFPISSVTSISVYVLGALLMWAVISFAIHQSEDNKPLPAEAIEVAGGGGSPEGQGTEGEGDRPPIPKTEDVNAPKTDSPTSIEVAARTDDKFDPLAPDPLTLPELQDKDVRVIDDPTAEAISRFAKMEPEARKRLFQGIAPSKGEGGFGSGGGKGKGIGKGEGDLEGDGKGKLSARQKRILRWVMQFNTLDGNDYLHQLRSLGAILAIPQPEGGYLVIRDLARVPVQGAKEDLNTIHRIFWIDDKPDSVESLRTALRLPYHPPHIVAFFPVELEKRLLDKELKYRGKKEEQIKETVFKVERSGAGYEPRVYSQR